MSELGVFNGCTDDDDILNLPPLRLQPGSVAALLGGTTSGAALARETPAAVVEEPAAPEPIAEGEGLEAEVRALRAEVESLKQELRAAVMAMHDALGAAARARPDGADHMTAALRERLALFRTTLVRH